MICKKPILVQLWKVYVSRVAFVQRVQYAMVTIALLQLNVVTVFVKDSVIQSLLASIEKISRSKEIVHTFYQEM